LLWFISAGFELVDEEEKKPSFEFCCCWRTDFWGKEEKKAMNRGEENCWRFLDWEW